MRVDEHGVLWQEDGRVGTDVVKKTAMPIGKPLKGVVGLTAEEALHFVLIVKSQIEEEKRLVMEKKDAKVKAKLWKIEELLRRLLTFLNKVTVQGSTDGEIIELLTQLRKAVEKYDRAKAKKVAKDLVGSSSIPA